MPKSIFLYIELGYYGDINIQWIHLSDFCKNVQNMNFKYCIIFRLSLSKFT